MKLKGSVFKFGHNVDTDVIIPARYLTSTDPQELAPHCMEDLDQNFATKVQNGDIIIAGKNFGAGSSREHAPLAIKGCGVACVIAESFARIFFRNSLNVGLPILECPEAAKNIDSAAKVEIDLKHGLIYDLSTQKTYQAQPFPQFLQEIIHAGGLIEMAKKELIKNDS